MTTAVAANSGIAQDPGHFAAHDGIRLHYRIHPPLAEARGGVLVMHGFAEHGGRYAELVDALTPAGYAIMTFDARGHGKSGGTRVYVESFAEYVHDLRAAIELASRLLPQPLYLFGHSQGGLIALRTLIDAPDLVKGLIVSNPALANKVQVPMWKALLAKGASRFAPRLTIPSGVPASDISRDPEAVRAYASDPLNCKDATSRWYTEFLGAQDEVLRRPGDLRGLPTLALIGTGDRIIDADVSRAYFDRVGSAAQVILYPGFYHELIHEPEADRTRVLADIRGWLDARLAS